MYKLAEQKLWTGRIDDESDANSYRLHQIIQFDQNDKNPEAHTFHIIGFECDEGVRRNKGRTGASAGPDAIRKQLAPLPYHFPSDFCLKDSGSIVCEDREMEKAQAELGHHVCNILRSDSIPLILGGGHETLYGHYLGVRKYIGEDKSLGVINIDAHFDLRKDQTPSSGTMFRQILESDNQADYLCLGIQEFGNTKALFNKADELSCQYILADDLVTNNFQETDKVINDFAKKHDYILLTLCTDSIISYAAPGVSAPSPFGLEPKTVKTLIQSITAQKNLLSFDISEVNPSLDEGNKTVKLAAYMVAEVMKGFLKR